MENQTDLMSIGEEVNGTEAGNAGGRLYQVPTSVVVILSLFYGLISLTAFVGNSLVIYVVVISRRMRTVTNMYIANLAFADVTIALFAIPFQFHAALLQRWDLPAFMCQFCPTVQILSVNISIFTLVAISLDRYRAIMYPLRRKPSKLFSKVVILLIWIFGLAFALPMGIVHTFGHVEDYTYINETGDEVQVEKPFCFIDFGPNATNSTMFTMFKYYSTSLLTVQYFLPMSIISVAYARIAFRLWGSKTPGAAQTDRDHNILLNKKKVIKMLLIVVCIFSICWLPWQVYMTTLHVYPQINNYRYINIIFFCCHWLAMSNSCYNPFIYGVYSEKFRREFAVRLPCLRCLKDTTPKPPNYQTNACTNGRTEVSQVPMHTKNGGRNYGAAARSPRSTNTKEIIHIEVHNKSFKRESSKEEDWNSTSECKMLQKEVPLTTTVEATTTIPSSTSSSRKPSASVKMLKKDENEDVKKTPVMKSHSEGFFTRSSSSESEASLEPLTQS